MGVAEYRNVAIQGARGIHENLGAHVNRMAMPVDKQYRRAGDPNNLAGGNRYRPPRGFFGTGLGKARRQADPIAVAVAVSRDETDERRKRIPEPFVFESVFNIFGDIHMPSPASRTSDCGGIPDDSSKTP